jgi:septum formation protein
MTSTVRQIVLGSRSPQRLALLRQIVPEEQIAVRPPRKAEEQGFAGLETWSEIESRLLDVARGKCADVVEQCRGQNRSSASKEICILTADTVIVAEDGGRQIVLGQPPEPDWRQTVRRWFENHLLGKTHRAATAVCLASLTGERRERVVVSEVTFHAGSADLLQWYLNTEEPRGKAGGYGIQGAGSLFVSDLKGSFTNVVGLPLLEIWEMLREQSGVLR